MQVTEKQRIVERIKKLLALAGQECSLEEAQAAFLKARELMQKYNVTLSEVEVLQDGVTGCAVGVSTLKESYFPTWVKLLARAVANGFDVRVIYDGHTSKKTVHFVGVFPDGLIGKQVFDFLYSYALRNAPDYKKVQQKTSWRLGFAHALMRRLSTQKRLETTQEQGLVLVKREVIERFVDQEYNGLLKPRALPKYNVHKTFHAGFEAGLAVNINRPIADAKDEGAKALATAS